MIKRNAQLTRRSRLGGLRTILLGLVLIAATSLLQGCTLLGAAIGAITGQALGGSTEATVAGALYGAIIGAEIDAHHAHGNYYYYYGND